MYLKLIESLLAKRWFIVISNSRFTFNQGFCFSNVRRHIQKRKLVALLHFFNYMGFAFKFEFPQKALPYQMEMNDCCNFKKNDVFYYRGLNTFFFQKPDRIQSRRVETAISFINILPYISANWKVHWLDRIGRKTESSRQELFQGF